MSWKCQSWPTCSVFLQIDGLIHNWGSEKEKKRGFYDFLRAILGLFRAIFYMKQIWRRKIE